MTKEKMIIKIQENKNKKRIIIKMLIKIKKKKLNTLKNDRLTHNKNL